MKKKNILKNFLFIGLISVGAILGTCNVAYADGFIQKSYPVPSEGYYITETGNKVFNAITFIDGTPEKEYYNGLGIDKLWFNTKEGGFGAYTPELKSRSPLWLKNPGLIYQNTQIGKASFDDNSGTQVQGYRTLKGGRVDPNDQSLASYQAGNGTSYIESAPFDGADDLVGQNLEFRFMGYTEKGTIISNPYFPADNPTSTTNAEYNWDSEANLSAFGFEKSPLDIDTVTKKQWINKYLLKDCITGQSSDLASLGDADYWINRFIVAGNPAITTGVWIGSRGGGSGYRTVTTTSEPKPNLRVSWLEIDKDGQQLGQQGEKGAFSRYSNGATTFVEANGKDKQMQVEKDADGNEIGLDRGETYHAHIYYKNISPPNHTTEYFFPTGLDRYVYYGKAEPFQSDPSYENATLKESIGPDKLIAKDKAANSEHIGAGAGLEFEYDFTVPEDASGYYKEAVAVPRGYSVVLDGNPSSGHDDFANRDNDAYLIYRINPNDLTITDIKFIDEDGMPTTEPDPTKKYKIQYVVKYVGSNMKEKVPVTIKDIAVTNKTGSLYSKPGLTLTQDVQMKKNDTITYETDYMEITEPYIWATGTVSSDPAWNEDEGKQQNNNTMSKFIQGVDWNLQLKIKSIDPVKTKVAEGGKTQSYVINYEVNYITPTSITESSLDTDVALKMTSSDVGNKILTDEISLKKGINNLSFVVDDVNLVSGNYDINFELMVNPTHTKPGYETVWPDDNIDSIKTTVVPDTDSPCARTDIENHHEWVQTFNLKVWDGGHWCDKHDRCEGRDYDYPTEDVDMYEDYKITKFDFTSKLESDTKGEGIIVDLMSNDGRIKAGYGFTLDLEYIYKTNRKVDQPREWSSCETGQKITATKISSLTVPTKIFVELPDGQLISNVAEKGAAQLLECTASGSWDNRTVKCSVKTGNTFGVKETKKLYIDENTKDGTYPMTACLEEFAGVPGKTNASFPTMYDKKETHIKVQGSYKDDVKLHIR
ncbi:hypothetical protein B0H39_005992 [Clostridium beijerinckii]|uniref:hypothetical protein n=1 Tax=Clostridium beijerinckii TaxID=1520 RepID=UPI00149405F1|nr:hypothetical protein [Clostridium beijerinckii]NOW87961.1 hypothetical protein [Clostridium beijerinckii]